MLGSGANMLANMLPICCRYVGQYVETGVRARGGRGARGKPRSKIDLKLFLSNLPSEIRSVSPRCCDGSGTSEISAKITENAEIASEARFYRNFVNFPLRLLFQFFPRFWPKFVSGTSEISARSAQCLF